MLLAVFGLVVFHAPLSVFFGQFSNPDLVKGWKEIIMLVLIPLVIFSVYRAGLLKIISRDRLLQLIGIYAALHLALLLSFKTSMYQSIAGLTIDLRYLLFFVLVYCVVILWPKSRGLFVKVGIFVAIFSITFALLQATLLPHDVLKNIGYSESTIEPYQTVDKNTDYIRVNGTLRGPNPLGAYIVIIISLLGAWALTHSKSFIKQKWLFVGSGILLVTTLWASYSRSAFIALLVSSIVIISIIFRKRLNLQGIVIAGTVLILMVSSIVLLRNSSFVQNVILHDNPTTGSSVDSNEAHVDSLGQGLERVVRQPFGAGIGSTGSASLKSDKPLIIENQYLFTAHESGWFGLGLFVVIYIFILGRLYNYRRDWLSLGVFASGIGLAIVGILLPVWVDDTVSLVWFGFAAVALGSHFKKETKKKNATTN